MSYIRNDTADSASISFIDELASARGQTDFGAIRPNESGISDAPIGVFDSGYGGLTVLRDIIAALPHESTVFVGDSAHFPYGPKPVDDLKRYVLGICEYLVRRGCKLIVIACNTASAAALKVAQRRFDVPIIGVVEPGARAAVHATMNRRIGIIATQGTVNSGAYENAIHNLDAGIDVFSVACPRFVDIAEAGIQFQLAKSASFAMGNTGQIIVSDRGVLDGEAGRLYEGIAEEYLAPLKDANVDTLVLGCTHFPLIEQLIAKCMGNGVVLVSSAEETALEVSEILARRGQLNSGVNIATHEYLTTGESVSEFNNFGSIVMGPHLGNVYHLNIWER